MIKILAPDDDNINMPGINLKGIADYWNVAPKVFNRSRINLNFTIKPIRTGLPLRIWDIMGCGGFVLTNYQEEIAEYFEVGRDLEVFGSEEELIEKTRYYLEHEEERAAIAHNGYMKVKEYHTWEKRMELVLETVFGQNRI